MSTITFDEEGDNVTLWTRDDAKRRRRMIRRDRGSDNS